VAFAAPSSAAQFFHPELISAFSWSALIACSRWVSTCVPVLFWSHQLQAPSPSLGAGGLPLPGPPVCPDTPTGLLLAVPTSLVGLGFDEWTVEVESPLLEPGAPVAVPPLEAVAFGAPTLGAVLPPPVVVDVALLLAVAVVPALDPLLPDGPLGELPRVVADAVEVVPALDPLALDVLEVDVLPFPLLLAFLLLELPGPPGLAALLLELLVFPPALAELEPLVLVEPEPLVLVELETLVLVELETLVLVELEPLMIELETLLIELETLLIVVELELGPRSQQRA
jgi:hypothetical protein